MNYLIISIYDSGYVWSVKTNNNFCNRQQYIKGDSIKGLENLLDKIDSLDIDYSYIRCLDYDFIVICEDGCIEILKDRRKR